MSVFALVTLAALLIASITVPSVMAARRNREDAWLTELALIDGATGLANRKRLERDLIACTTERPDVVAVLVLAIDDFDAVRSEHGSPVGDRVLSMVGSCVARQLRTKDVVYRPDGGEFCVILREADAPVARRVAERIRSATTRLLPPLDAGVTVTIGVAVGLGVDVNRTLALADSAMRAAASSGRDRVVFSGDA